MSKIKNNCAICLNEYFHKRSKKNSKYCSRLCANRGAAWGQKKPLNKLNCLECNKEFEFYKWDRKNAQYCSVICKGLGARLTDKQKLERMIQYYERDVIKKEGCWGWNGIVMSNGYGSISQGRDKKIGAHRASWLIHNGPIPNGMFVLHRCDIPICSAPIHLFLGTSKDNSIDARNKGRGKGYFKKGQTPHNKKHIKV